VLRPCGRAPSYSGRCIARAVELYRDGVKPGAIRWDDLQRTLVKEFPSDFPKVSDNLPSPETVMNWVRKYPDLAERLKQLRVQQVAPNRVLPEQAFAYTSQPWPVPLVQHRSIAGLDTNGLIGLLMALLVMNVMARCIRFALTD
jgi:hypothetical protein